MCLYFPFLFFLLLSDYNLIISFLSSFPPLKPYHIPPSLPFKFMVSLLTSFYCTHKCCLHVCFQCCLALGKSISSFPSFTQLPIPNNHLQTFILIPTESVFRLHLSPRKLLFATNRDHSEKPQPIKRIVEDSMAFQVLKPLFWTL